MWFSALVLNKMPFSHQYVLVGRYCVINSNTFFCVLLPLFFDALYGTFSSRRDTSSHLRQVSIPFFKHILKLCTLLLHVEGVGFVLRMRDASPSTNPSFKHDPCKALSVIRTILPAVAPIWLTRKSHVSIRYLIILVSILRLIPLAPPPLLPHPSCCGMAVNWGIISFGFVPITAGTAMPTSAKGMYCLGEKKREIENYKDSTLFN